MKTLLFIGLLKSLLLSASCTGSSSHNSSNTSTTDPIPVGAFMSEYSRSKEAARTKYEGKGLNIRGYVLSAPLMPNSPDATGVLVLSEKGGDMALILTCYFKESDKAAFAELNVPSTVVVSGTFDDSISTALKPCRLVEILD